MDRYLHPKSGEVGIFVVIGEAKVGTGSLHHFTRVFDPMFEEAKSICESIFSNGDLEELLTTVDPGGAC